jgi:membrane-bound lytic murein transglycosylase D
LRLNLVPLIALSALIAACAAPGPERPAPVSEPVAVPEPPAPAPPVVVSEAEPPPVAQPFPPSVAETLQSLPPPAEDIWVRIRKGFAMPDLEDPLVTKWEEWYAARPDYVARMIDRSRRYLYHIVIEVEERHMPSEIALLPMIESAYNPNALSTSRASGIWQFIPSTGTHYGLKQNFWFDSRRDVIAGTEGALTYLTKLYGDFDNWQLALAAYNWGEGNVAKAIAFNQKKGLPADYANLKMPDETRNYLPKLQAVKNLINDPARWGIVLEDIPDAPYFAVVHTTKKMDVKRAAELAEMPLEEFQFLNPRYNRPVIAGADQYTLLLPIDKAELFAAKLDLTDQPLVSWQAYRMRNGETLAQVAAKFAIPVESLRAVNGLGTKAKVPPGHTLLVPSARPSSEAELGLAQAVFTTVPQGRTFYYRVNRGDTLARIASRYDVSVQDIRRWNGLTQSTVVAGQSLRITSDSAPNVGKAKRATGRKATASASAKAPAKQVGATPGGQKPAPTKNGNQAKTGVAAGS